MARRLMFVSGSVTLDLDVNFEEGTYEACLLLKNAPVAGNTAREWTALGCLPAPWSFTDLQALKKALKVELPDHQIGLWSYSHLKEWLRDTAQDSANYFLRNPNIATGNLGSRGELTGKGSAYGLKALTKGLSIGEVGTQNAKDAGIWDVAWLQSNNLTVAHYTKGQTPNKVKA